jgi:hypothetical protein
MAVRYGSETQMELMERREDHAVPGGGGRAPARNR